MMFELRYVAPEGAHVPSLIPRLQFREQKWFVDNNGHLTGGVEWGEWIDVPIVVLRKEDE